MSRKNPNTEWSDGKETHCPPFSPVSLSDIFANSLHSHQCWTCPSAGQLSLSKLLWECRGNGACNKARHQFFISSLITKLLAETASDTLQVSLNINKIDFNELNQLQRNWQH